MGSVTPDGECYTRTEGVYCIPIGCSAARVTRRCPLDPSPRSWSGCGVGGATRRCFGGKCQWRGSNTVAACYACVQARHLFGSSTPDGERYTRTEGVYCIPIGCSAARVTRRCPLDPSPRLRSGCYRVCGAMRRCFGGKCLWRGSNTVAAWRLSAAPRYAS